MQLPLFSADQLDFVPEANGRKILAPTEPYFWRAAMTVWDDFKLSRASDPRFVRMRPKDAASWLNHQTIAMAAEIAGEFPEAGLRHAVVRQQEHFVVGNDCIAIFKKITKRRYRNGYERFERSNFLTEGNLRRWRQEKEDGFPDLPKFIIGMEFVREMSDMRLYIGYPRALHRGFQWIYRMADYSQMWMGVATPAPTLPTADSGDKDFMVIARKDAKEKESGK